MVILVYSYIYIHTYIHIYIYMEGLQGDGELLRPPDF